MRFQGNLATRIELLMAMRHVALAIIDPWNINIAQEVRSWRWILARRRIQDAARMMAETIDSTHREVEVEASSSAMPP